MREMIYNWSMNESNGLEPTPIHSAEGTQMQEQAKQQNPLSGGIVSRRSESEDIKSKHRPATCAAGELVGWNMLSESLTTQQRRTRKAGGHA